MIFLCLTSIVIVNLLKNRGEGGNYFSRICRKFITPFSPFFWGWDPSKTGQIATHLPFNPLKQENTVPKTNSCKGLPQTMSRLKKF